jgi:hypothetical protein
MKTKKEIEQLAEQYFPDPYICTGKEGFIDGYTQCQEDMVKELYEFGKLVLDTFHSEGKTHSGEDRLARIKFDEWFNSLNKQD